MKFFNVRKSQKKNTNFIKFIVKHFCEEFPVALYSDDQDLVDEFNELQQKHEEGLNKPINRQWLNSVFVNSRHSHIYRLFMFYLLQNNNFLNRKILKRNYMRDSNKKQYLLCLPHEV